jgi:NAD(P)H-dependent flavin oxidoreductase YrpB (nitropropane dioxygenase family)
VPEVAPLPTPDFYPIVSSDLLARILATKLPEGLIAGWIIEGPIAGGHNAPPRAKKYDENENPIYDERDVADLTKVAALGYPYYLAGGYGTPEKVAEALSAGAAGVQIGSLFSLADESGYPADYKRRMITDLHRKSVVLRTDGRISPTGFPFKVLEIEDTNGIPEANRVRTRNCDLGYLQQAYVDSKGRLLARCPAEPVEDYVRKGGKAEDTERRGCLCNGLMANIGLPQKQKWGLERPLFTGGDELLALPLGSAESPMYSAEDVIEYLHGRRAMASNGQPAAYSAARPVSTAS